MPAPTRIRIRPARGATLLALVLLITTRFAGVQTRSTPSRTEATQLSVPLLSREQMTADDRAAAEAQQQTIATSAQFYGYTLDSSYSYREIACPVAPDHLLLAYEATSPNGSVSRFTAVVRHGAEEETVGRHSFALIIPILHFGVVPFVPAIANPHSIEVFNAAISTTPTAIEVLSDTQAGKQPLLVRSLCYLAMVGEEPAALRSPGLEQATIHAPIPTLVFQDRGKIRQSISIRSSPNSYQVWALTFQSAGKLLSATREQHPIDRTPIVLNAANNGSPAEPTTPPTTPTTANRAPSQVSAQPAISTPVTPEPADLRLSCPRPSGGIRQLLQLPPPVPPAPTAPLATAETAKPPALPTPPPAFAAPTAPSANAEVSQPPSPPSRAENTAAVTEPVTAPASSPAASMVQPVAPAIPAMAAPPSPTTKPASAVAPAPTVPEATSATMEATQPAAPASAAFPAAVSAATATVMQPIVKQSPLAPPGRFIPNPPQPPSRFIPDSALKTPPHLPQ